MLSQVIICFPDAMETKNERYFKYLSTRMRAIERKCEKEQPAPSSFNDEVSTYRNSNSCVTLNVTVSCYGLTINNLE